MLSKNTGTSKRYVYGVRLWLKDGHQPMADLALGDGGRPSGEIVTIEWTDVNARENYLINGYTFIWDERLPAERTFEEFLAH